MLTRVDPTQPLDRESPFVRPLTPGCATAVGASLVPTTRACTFAVVALEWATTPLNAIITRHDTLTEFLRLFEIDEDTIYADVEGMEHHISKATLGVITTLVEELKSNTELLSRLKSKL